MEANQRTAPTKSSFFEETELIKSCIFNTA